MVALSGGASKWGRVWGDSQGTDLNHRASSERMPEWGIQEGEEQWARDAYNSL